MVYGRRPPKGYLPAYSVDTEAEAAELIARCCERVTYGSNKALGWLAPELERGQTLENLFAFGERLHAEYQKMLAEKRAAAGERGET